MAVVPGVAMARCNALAPNACLQNSPINSRPNLNPMQRPGTPTQLNSITRNADPVYQTQQTNNAIRRNRNTIREITTPPEGRGTIAATQGMRSIIDQNQNTLRDIATPPEVRGLNATSQSLGVAPSTGRRTTYIENGNVTVISPDGEVEYTNGRALQ